MPRSGTSGVVRVGTVGRSTFVPDATELQRHVFVEALRRAGTGHDAARYMRSFSKADVREQAAHISVPVLLTHRRRDVVIPFESGLEAARIIPNAQFLALEGQNHVFLPGEAEGQRAFEATLAFFDKDRERK